MAGRGQGSGRGSTCYRINVGFEPDEAASPGYPHGASGNTCVSLENGPQQVRNRPMRAEYKHPSGRAVPKTSSCRSPRPQSGKGRVPSSPASVPGDRPAAEPAGIAASCRCPADFLDRLAVPPVDQADTSRLDATQQATPPEARVCRHPSAPAHRRATAPLADGASPPDSTLRGPRPDALGNPSIGSTESSSTKRLSTVLLT